MNEHGQGKTLRREDVGILDYRRAAIEVGVERIDMRTQRLIPLVMSVRLS